MKFKLFTLLIVLLPSFMLAIDSSSAFHYKVDNKGKHEFELQHQIVHTFKNTDIVVTPRMKFSREGDIDLTTGVGIRHFINDMAFGIHACWDGNQLQSKFSHQFTLATEYFFSNWAIRSNHYFPISPAYIKNNSLFTPVYWMENSLTRKFNYLSTSLGSVYDFNSKACYVKSDVFIPVKGFVLGIHGICPVNHNSNSNFSLSFSYPLSNRNGKHSEPVIRNSKVHYLVTDRCQTDPFPVQDPVTEEIDMVVEELGEIIKQVPVEVIEEIEDAGDEEVISWLDWFKSFFSYDNSNDPYGPHDEDYYYYGDYNWSIDDSNDSSDSVRFNPSPSLAPSISHAPAVAVNIPESPVSSSNSESSGPSPVSEYSSHSSSSSDLSDVPTPDFTPNSSLDLSLDAPSQAESSPSVLDTPFSDIGSPSSWDPSSLPALDFSSVPADSHYGSGDFYDPNRAESDSSPSDNGWTSVKQ